MALFQNPQKCADNCAEVRGSAPHFSPGLNEKWKCADSAEVRRTAQSLPFSYGQKPAPDGSAETCDRTNLKKATRPSVADLGAELRLLQAELGEVFAARQAAERALSPFQDAFYAADQRLRALIEKHGPGPREDAGLRETILKAYTARTLAGHRAHPYRQALKQVEALNKAIVERIREINEELEA